nr:MAG TPA: hypothetical protein [Caudoviricetes sp.]
MLRKLTAKIYQKFLLQKFIKNVDRFLMAFLFIMRPERRKHDSGVRKRAY